MRPLPEQSVRFRARIIDAIAPDASRFWYSDENTCAGLCPGCGGVLSVYFHGRAASADLTCRSGCDDAEILAGLAPKVSA